MISRRDHRGHGEKKIEQLKNFSVYSASSVREKKQTGKIISRRDRRGHGEKKGSIRISQHEFNE
jgi:hypothetical protein